jgi:hypothetical protein
MLPVLLSGISIVISAARYWRHGVTVARECLGVVDGAGVTGTG